MVVRLGHDLVGVVQPLDAEPQLAQVRVDHAGSGHGAPPTTRWTTDANLLHSRRFSRTAFFPPAVSEYVRRGRPPLSDHALCSSPAFSSRWSAGYTVPSGSSSAASERRC